MIPGVRKSWPRDLWYNRHRRLTLSIASQVRLGSSGSNGLIYTLKLPTTTAWISLLLNALGVEGIELYNTFSFETDSERASDEEESVAQPSFDAVLKRFDDHFLASVNVTFERHLFFIRDQKAGESVDRYVTALRTLASTCEFGDLREPLIRDRFVCGLKERLLRTSKLTLQKAIDSCRAAEAECK